MHLCVNQALQGWRLPDAGQTESVYLDRIIDGFCVSLRWSGNCIGTTVTVSPQADYNPQLA